VDCERCAAACCLVYDVGITSDEIAALEARGHRGFTRDAVAVPSGVPPEVASRHLGGLRFGKYLAKKSGGECVFLEWATGGAGACSVYNYRPGVCLDFGEPGTESAIRCRKIRRPLPVLEAAQ